MIYHTTIEVNIPEGHATLSVQFWYAPATWGPNGGGPEECEVISARDVEDQEDRWEELPADIQEFIIQKCLTQIGKVRRVYG